MLCVVDDGVARADPIREWGMGTLFLGLSMIFRTGDRSMSDARSRKECWPDLISRVPSKV